MKQFSPILLGVALCLLAPPSIGGAQDANARAARTVISDTTPAREVDTWREDVALINQCIRRGGEKEACVCVPFVLKYEMSVGEYREAAGTRLRQTPAPRLERGRAETDEARTISVATRTERAPDFAQRCAVAKRFFDRD